MTEPLTRVRPAGGRGRPSCCAIRRDGGLDDMPTETTEIQDLANREYTAGFVTDIESESAPPGLNEDIVRFISAKKNEPQWMLDWRLKAYRHWLTMEDPHGWAKVSYEPIDYQAACY